MTQTIVFTDKSFDAKNILNYHLSLQVFLKGLSFCVLDREKNKFIALGHYYYKHIVSYNKILEIISQMFEENEILKLPYIHTKIIFNTKKFTFIPSAFYKPKTTKQMFEFNHTIEKNEQLLTNYLFSNSSYVLFAIPNFIKTWINKTIPNAKIYHQSVPFIDEILLNTKTQPTQENIYINMHHSFFDVAFVKNACLKLYNSYTYKSDNDFKYFVLNIYDQLKLSPTTVPIIFSGFANKNDNKIEQIRKFVKHIGFFKKPLHFQYSFEFNSIEEHYFTNMLNLYQCG